MTVSLKIYALVVVLVLAAVVRGDQQTQVPTDCNQQLWNYYVALGMPMVTPVLPAFNFTSGVDLGIPYVRFTGSVQSVALFYANLLPNTTLANATYNSYYRIGIPWCASPIDYHQCVANATTGTAKTGNCTTQSDFDQGGPNPVAGYQFIYVDQQSPGCNGDINITYYNTSILAGQNATYGYDAVGIRDHVLQSYAQARESYRRSYCLFSDGDPIDMLYQNVFMCVGPMIGCASTRPSSPPLLPSVPIPQFRCIGPINNTINATVTRAIWTVSNANIPGTPDTQFGFACAADLSFQANIAAVFSVFGVYHVLSAGERAQFDSGFSTMQHYCFLYYGGVWTSFKAQYWLSTDPVIEQVPCGCDFTLVCNSDGTVDYSEPSMQTAYGNGMPSCDAGVDTELPLGTLNFTLDGSRTFDPDDSPFALTRRWGVLASSSPITIPDPSATVQVINISTLPVGQYAFVQWASDLQDQVDCIVNLTIAQPQLFAITQPDAVVQFTFYSGKETAHPCTDYPPQPSIPVLGNYSFSTLATSILTYLWTQVSGPPLNFDCDSDGFSATRAIFNTTEPILQFVPDGPYLYCFQLVISDGITNSTPSPPVCIQVQAAFGQPPSSFTPINNYTDPPLVYFSDPPVPHIPFDNVTLPPFNTFPPVTPPPPPTNTNVSWPFTPVPEPTWTDIVAFFIIFLGSYVVLMLTGRFIAAFREEDEYAFLDKVVYPRPVRGTNIS
jgi:hypothetical protein